MPVQLDAQAAALLKRIQVEAGSIDEQVEKKIAEQAPAQGSQVLSVEQVEQVLISAMPDKKQLIEQCKDQVKGYALGQQNPQFLSQIIEIRVQKENLHAEVSHSAAPPGRRDPYYAKLQMDPRADFMLLFNARDVDRSGRPLLMKIVAREGADLSGLDLKRYRTHGDQTDISKFDVMKVRPGQDYVEMTDVNEPEFTFGDPLKQVSVGSKGEELSTSVKVRPKNTQLDTWYPARWDGRQYHPDTNQPARRSNRAEGDQLDRQRVITFDDRIHLTMAMGSDFPADGWLDSPPVKFGQEVKAELVIDHGLMFEPGSTATVTYAGVSAKTAVAADDAQMLGSESARVPVTSSTGYPLRHWLTQLIARGVGTVPQDTHNQNFRAVDLIFADKANIGVGGGTLDPLADTPLANASFKDHRVQVHKRPISGDGGSDDQKISLTLDAGVLRASGESSVKGWTVKVGFTDAAGKWQQQEATVKKDAESQKMSFDFDLLDADKIHADPPRNLEVRLYNQDGVPAQRVLVPFREVDWDPSLRQGAGQGPDQGD